MIAPCCCHRNNTSDTNRASSMIIEYLSMPYLIWKPERESNSRRRFCRPRRNHSDTRPSVLLWCPRRDSNPQHPEPKSGASTNWTTGASAIQFWWTLPDLNRSPPECKSGALPDELRALNLIVYSVYSIILMLSTDLFGRPSQIRTADILVKSQAL